MVSNQSSDFYTGALLVVLEQVARKAGFFDARSGNNSSFGEKLRVDYNNVIELIANQES